MNDFYLLSMLPLSQMQFSLDGGPTWWGYTFGKDLGAVRLWEMYLVKIVFNELINDFDILSPLSL